MHLALLPPGPSLAAFAVALAAVSWILGRWRDLSPAVAGLVAGALALDLTPITVGAASAAGLLGAAGVFRSARAGVARPELTALVVAACVPAIGLPDRAAAAWCAVVGVGAAVAAAEGRVGVPRVRWIGRIPVEKG